MGHDLHPQNGVRVLLELVEGRVDGASYTASLYLPAERIDYRVEMLVPSAEVTLTPVGKPASEELAALLKAQARIVSRGKVKQPDEPWPARLLRWREI